MPLEGTNPFIGNINELEKVKESRIETIVEEKDLKRVVNAMIKAHPYEEVAYDIYKLENQGKTFGYGRIGGEINEIHLNKYLKTIKEKLDTEYLIVYGNDDKIVKKCSHLWRQWF